LAGPALAEQTQESAATLLRACEAARCAAELSPHDAKIWLLLAALDARADPKGRDVPGALKMSYYTGRNEASLRPLRLAVATQGRALTDAELQSLPEAELGTIIVREPGVRPAIVAAYRGASEDGKRFLQLKLGELDPNWLATIRSTP
jgi:hypothetical protein